MSAPTTSRGDAEPTDAAGDPAPAEPPPTTIAPSTRSRRAEPASARSPSARRWSTGFKDAGAPVVRFLDMVGGHLILIGARAVVAAAPAVPRSQNYLEAAEYIGFGSLPIVLLVGAFTGDGDVAAVGRTRSASSASSRSPAAPPARRSRSSSARC